MRSLVFLLAGLAAVAAQSCQEDEILYYADSQYCDRYTQCKHGVVTEEICPPGLLFNDLVSNGAYPCQYPVEVDCGSRSKTQPPVSSENCPNAWGYFGTGDRTNCGYFFNCVDGQYFQFTCPEGLAFSSSSYRCEWADESPDCDASAFLGVSCPAERDAATFLSQGHVQLRSPQDCRKFFTCVGVSPRLAVCDVGLVFNEATSACDEPENVRGCETYYPPEELAAIRERKERSRIAAAKRQEEYEQLRAQLAQRRAAGN